jgi:transcriptional regulator with XRE-family HTH domain
MPNYTIEILHCKFHTMSALVRQGRLFGSKLRSLRRRNGLTLEELSTRCVQLDAPHAPSVSYLSMLETGKRTPSPEMLSVIAGVFGKEPRWFLDGHDDDSAKASGIAADRAAPELPREPSFLFSHVSLRHALPELLAQTGTSGRQFAQLLVRVWQETHGNDFPDIERAAEEAAERQMPLDLATLKRICERHGLAIRWIEDDRRRLDRGLHRARFEAPGTVLVSRRLADREARLKYELAFFLGHRILHGGDGGIAPIAGDAAYVAEPANGASSALGARDALHAWREFECSFFAGALLCPKRPFRELLARERHRVAIHRRLGVGPAVVMRRMTAVSPYRHWHFFDAYPPGYLRTVYRGNRIPLPWGNLSLVPDPCPNWAVFRMLREHGSDGASGTQPSSQVSVMLDGGRPRLFCCHSILTRDAADALRVLSVGIDLEPALEAQGFDAPGTTEALWQSCRKGGGEAAIAARTADALRTVAHVLGIEWLSDALGQPAAVICSRSAACPRRSPCGN